MKRISSRFLFLSKKVFPLIWFGFLAQFVLVAFFRGGDAMPLPILIVPCVMAIFGYFLMKKLVWDLADEVWDCGDHLLVKNRGSEERIYLSDIMNVSASTLMNPPRITLRLVRPSQFGTEISFSPASPFSLNLFAKNAVAEDLIVRVDKARVTRAV
jgi:hypothetical protein